LNRAASVSFSDISASVTGGISKLSLPYIAFAPFVF
jgi:hypothetical protein